MDEPRLTVGVVSAGRTKCLRECVSSIEENIKVPLRLLVVDSFPNKESESAVRKVKNSKYVSLEKPVGPSEARSIIASKVNTKYLLFMDGDHVVEKRTVEKMIDFISKTDTDIVCGILEEKDTKREIGQIFLDVNTSKGKGIMKKFIFEEEINEKEVKSIRVDGGMSTMLISKESIEKIKIDKSYNFYYDMFDLFMQCKRENMSVKVLLNAKFKHRPRPYPSETKRQTGNRGEDKERFERKWGVRHVGRTGHVTTEDSSFIRFWNNIKSIID